MAKLSKRVRAQREKIEAGKVYALVDALGLVKDVAAAKSNKLLLKMGFHFPMGQSFFASEHL